MAFLNVENIKTLNISFNNILNIKALNKTKWNKIRSIKMEWNVIK